MIQLLIDTSSNAEIVVGLKVDRRIFLQKQKVDFRKAQVVLPMIDKILKKHSFKPENISAIQVNAGPGSFTGLRVGLAIANALSFVLKIPVNGKKIGEIVLPIYK